MAAGLASGIATEAAIVSKAWSCVEDVAVAAAIAGAVVAPVTEAVAAIAAAAIASGAVPPWPELAPATDAVAKTSVGAAVRGIVTATASAMAADGRSCLGSVESAAGASPKSGFAIDFESSAFAGWDFDLESFAASGFAPVSVIVCSAGAESPPGASLFAG